MTLHVAIPDDLAEGADRLVDEIINRLVRGLRETYGTTVPTDDRLADIENTVRCFIWKHVPAARGG